MLLPHSLFACFLILSIYCMCAVVCFISVYIFVPHVCLEPSEARRGPELQMVVSSHVHAGNRTLILCNLSRHPELLSHLSSCALFCETRSCFLPQVGLKLSVLPQPLQTGNSLPPFNVLYSSGQMLDFSRAKKGPPQPRTSSIFPMIRWNS